MTSEEHLRAICGDKDFQIAVLRAKIDELQKVISEVDLPQQTVAQTNGRMQAATED